MQNARVESGRLPPKFPKKAWQARLGVPERAVHAAVRVKPKVHWRTQDEGAVRNMEHLQKATHPNM